MNTDLFGVAIEEPKPRRAYIKTHRDFMLEHRIFLSRNPVRIERPPVPHEEIVLIGCGKSKLAYPAAAKDLYIGPLFTAWRRYAEASGKRWWIVSAKYGLLDPETVIEPYDVKLGDTGGCATMFVPVKRQLIEAWGKRVCDALAPLIPGTADAELHMGANYVQGITSARASFLRKISTPAAGLGTGPQLSFYKSLRQQP